MRVLGIITARGGSKGIAKKNIQPLAGKPLIAYTIAAARASKLLTRCVVSTEDDTIKKVALEAGGDVPFMRPAELATDTSRSIDVVQHALGEVLKQGDAPYDAVMVLQPTSPLRTADDIDACIELYTEKMPDSVISITQLTGLTIDRLKEIKDGFLVSALQTETEGMPRQLLPALYKRNGAIYLTATTVVQAGSLYGKKSLPYIMPAERSVDINEPSDLVIASALLQ